MAPLVAVLIAVVAADAAASPTSTRHVTVTATRDHAGDFHGTYKRVLDPAAKGSAMGSFVPGAASKYEV